MVLTEEAANNIYEEFKHNYGKLQPSAQATSIGLSKIKVVLGRKRLRHGDSLEDFCISVGLTNLQSGDKLTQEYKGMRIFYKYMGKAFLLSQ